MASTKTTKPAAKAPRKPAAKVVEAPKRTLAEIGKDAQREAQRKALLAELRAQDWNLSAVARELGMGDASAVIRAIRKVGLESEYEAARHRGDVRPGARQTE